MNITQCEAFKMGFRGVLDCSEEDGIEISESDRWTLLALRLIEPSSNEEAFFKELANNSLPVQILASRIRDFDARATPPAIMALSLMAHLPGTAVMLAYSVALRMYELHGSDYSKHYYTIDNFLQDFSLIPMREFMGRRWDEQKIGGSNALDMMAAPNPPRSPVSEPMIFLATRNRLGTARFYLGLPKDVAREIYDGELSDHGREEADEAARKAGRPLFDNEGEMTDNEHNLCDVLGALDPSVQVVIDDRRESFYLKCTRQGFDGDLVNRELDLLGSTAPEPVKPKAYTSWSCTLLCDCPHCGEGLDLVDIPDSMEDAGVFGTKGVVEVKCPKCKGNFLAEIS